MKRWAIIRHVRYFYHVWKFNRWWKTARYTFIVPNKMDLEYLDGIWEGAW